MPKSTYESLSGTVLDFKKSHKIGRFDPTAPEKEAQKVRAMWKEIEEKGKPSISTTDLLLCAVRKSWLFKVYVYLWLCMHMIISKAIYYPSRCFLCFPFSNCFISLQISDPESAATSLKNPPVVGQSASLAPSHLFRAYSMLPGLVSP